ncbi:ThiF family adenylyltransferase [Candidatus Woesearchaeota archaeon]|nr:ThiF family adenylyltransferase [Candidatus Woesearchaeota archaeon]
MKLQLSPSIYILEDKEGAYHIIHTAIRRIRTFKVDNLVKEVIDTLAEEKEESEIKRHLEERYTPGDVCSCIDALEKAGIVRRYEPEQIINSPFSRQISFLDELTESWEETCKLQERLQNSRIAVFGVGGIGTWIVNGLYQIGIGEIRISDPDIVQKTNLNRQLYYGSKDIGRKKVEVLKDKIPDAKIISFTTEVSPEADLEAIVDNVDFIVNCADYPSVAETTRIIDSVARKRKIPYSVAGGYNMHLGMVGPIIAPGETACFDCFLAYQKASDSLQGMKIVKNIEQTGSLGPIAGAVANMHVVDIFKYITGRGRYNKNRFAEINFLDLSIEWREFDKNPKCKVCHLD